MIIAAAMLGCQTAQPVVEAERAPVARDASFFKGVNFTAERPAPYDSDAAVETLRMLPEFGINAVALVPYAGARLGSPELRFPLGMEKDEGIRRISQAAHEAGLRVILKPQVWYRGGYPGEHDLETDEQLDAFFARYGELVAHYARLAEETHAARRALERVDTGGQEALFGAAYLCRQLWRRVRVSRVLGRVGLRWLG
jgi:hypothetical protein